MTNERAKKETLDKLRELLLKVNQTSLKPQTKIKILTQAIYSRLSFELKVYAFDLTWISNELDSLVYYYLRQWLEMPVSSCMNETLGLPLKMYGLNVS